MCQYSSNICTKLLKENLDAMQDITIYIIKEYLFNNVLIFIQANGDFIWKSDYQLTFYTKYTRVFENDRLLSASFWKKKLCQYSINNIYTKLLEEILGTIKNIIFYMIKKIDWIIFEYLFKEILF